MTVRKEVTRARLLELFEYNRDTGILTNRIDRKSAKAGKEAGYLHKESGYRCVKIDGAKYQVHRIIWMLIYGNWPSGQIDHIDHERSNNILDNLRDVTHLENQRNAKLRNDNKTGSPGVHRNGTSGKYEAYIYVGGVKEHLKTTPNFEEAKKARKEAEKKYGFHPNHGKSDLEIQD